MAKKVDHISLKKSTVAGKAPTTDVLVDGELAVNIAEGGEKIFLRNTKPEIVEFSSDKLLDKKYLSTTSGGTVNGETTFNKDVKIAYPDSGSTPVSLREVMVDNEMTVAAALNDLNTRITEQKTDIDNLSQKYLPLSGGTVNGALTVTGNTELKGDVKIVYPDSSSQTVSLREVMLENEKVTAAALNDLNERNDELSTKVTEQKTDIDNLSQKYLPLSGGTMSGNITSPQFIKTNATADDILLGNGTTKDVNDFLQISGGTVTGVTTFSGGLKFGYPDVSSTPVSLRDVIADNEEVTAAALNDLNTRVDEIETRAYPSYDGATKTLKVKNIQGEATDGTTNSSLVLGDMSGNTYTSATHNIANIGTNNSILIGDSTIQKDLYVMSSSELHLAAKDAISIKSAKDTTNSCLGFNVNASTDVFINANSDINMKASTGDISLDSNNEGYFNSNDNLYLGSRKAIKLGVPNISNSLTYDNLVIEKNTVDNKVNINTSSDTLSFVNTTNRPFISADGNTVSINSNGSAHMIQTNCTLSGEYVKFRADKDNTMRLNAAKKDTTGNIIEPGGLRVFTNLFAMTDHVTDFTNQTINAKNKVSGTSVQSLLAEHEDKLTNISITPSSYGVNTVLGGANTIIISNLSAEGAITAENSITANSLLNVYGQLDAHGDMYARASGATTTTGLSETTKNKLNSESVQNLLGDYIENGVKLSETDINGFTPSDYTEVKNYYTGINLRGGDTSNYNYVSVVPDGIKHVYQYSDNGAVEYTKTAVISNGSLYLTLYDDVNNVETSQCILSSNGFIITFNKHKCGIHAVYDKGDINFVFSKMGTDYKLNIDKAIELGLFEIIPKQ